MYEGGLCMCGCVGCMYGCICVGVCGGVLCLGCVCMGCVYGCMSVCMSMYVNERSVCISGICVCMGVWVCV